MVSLFRGRDSSKAQRKTTTGQTQLLPETLWAKDPMPTGVPPEDKVVVTISRQFGSGGAEVGRLVAAEADLHYVDQEIIAEVARRLGVDIEHASRQDEQTDGMVGHILEAMQSTNPYTVNYSTLLTPTRVQAQSKELAYLRLTQRVILELASQGNTLIVGRGSQFLLRSTPRTLHIYIFAPLPYRINNVMRQLALSHDKALQLIEQRDYEHDRYLLHYYGNNGHQPGLYHLLINTGLFSFELAADLIRQAIPVIKTMN
jgi:cytidylate kinase